mmetsp:Transcript_223/g.281  ORF Transcript_223/g.281 Transcript_223/m.281 type:complete len:80 (-) Transcript_223:466-705(-)
MAVKKSSSLVFLSSTGDSKNGPGMCTSTGTSPKKSASFGGNKSKPTCLRRITFPIMPRVDDERIEEDLVKILRLFTFDW